MAWISAHYLGDVNVPCKPPASISSHESYMHNAHSLHSYSSTNRWPIAEPHAFRPRLDHFPNLEFIHLSSSHFDFYHADNYHFTVDQQHTESCLQYHRATRLPTHI